MNQYFMSNNDMERRIYVYLQFLKIPSLIAFGLTYYITYLRHFPTNIKGNTCFFGKPGGYPTPQLQMVIWRFTWWGGHTVPMPYKCNQRNYAWTANCNLQSHMTRLEVVLFKSQICSHLVTDQYPMIVPTYNSKLCFFAIAANNFALDCNKSL